MTNPLQTFVPESSLFAKLLAEENLRVQIQPSLTTAAFDPTARLLMLPSYAGFDHDAWLLFIAHEVGHAKFTPRDALTSPAVLALMTQYGAERVRHTLNVLEDIRIERLIRRRYQGLAGVFARGYRSLVQAQFFGFPEHKCPWSQYGTLDRLNLYGKVGSLLHLRLIDPQDQQWYARAAQAETFAEILALAVELLETLTQDATPTPAQPQTQASPEMPAQASCASPSMETTASDETSQDETDETSQDETDETAAGADASDETEETEETETAAPSAGEETEEAAAPEAQAQTPTVDPFATKTQDAAEQALARAAKGCYSASDRVTVLPRSFAHLQANDWTMEEALATWTATPAQRQTLQSVLLRERKQASAVLASMVNTFRMYQSAWQHRREVTSRTGLLDMTKLSQHKLIEDLFLRRTELPVAQNHGLVLTIDWSGSMQYSLSTVLWQVMHLIWFAEALRIPVEVYAFADAVGLSPRFAEMQKRLLDKQTADRGTDRWTVADEQEQTYYRSTYRFPSMIQWYRSSAPKAQREDMQAMLFSLLLAFGEFTGLFNYDASKRLATTEQGYGLPSLPKSLRSTAVALSMQPGFSTWEEWSRINTPLRSLGATPLYRALASMTEYVRAFRQRHRIEQCVSVFLTDGDDTHGFHPGEARDLPVSENPYRPGTHQVGHSAPAVGPLLDPVTGRTYQPIEGANTALNQMLALHRARTGATVVVVDITDQPLKTYRRVLSAGQCAPMETGLVGERGLVGRRAAKVQKQTRRKVIVRQSQASFPQTGLYAVSQAQQPALGCDAMLVSHPSWWTAENVFLKKQMVDTASAIAYAQDEEDWDDDGLTQDHVTRRVDLSKALLTSAGPVAMRKFADLLVPFLAEGRVDAR